MCPHSAPLLDAGRILLDVCISLRVSNDWYKSLDSETEKRVRAVRWNRHKWKFHEGKLRSGKTKQRITQVDRGHVQQYLEPAKERDPADRRGRVQQTLPGGINVCKVRWEIRSTRNKGCPKMWSRDDVANTLRCHGRNACDAIIDRCGAVVYSRNKVIMEVQLGNV